jgi:hypothetical protein
MWVCKFLFIGIILIALVKCSVPSKDYAPEENYYFSVSAVPNNPQTEKIKTYLETNIPKQKYTITNRSGLTWPYYHAFDLDEPVIKDSLMTPHWIIHRMVLHDEKKEIKEGEHLVKIEVNADSAFYYHVIVFTQVETGLRLTAKTPKHFIDSTHIQQSDWPIYLLQSVIRDSFK